MKLKDIQRLHRTRTAKKGKLYYDDRGRVYIGTEIGQLKLYDNVIAGENIEIDEKRGIKTVSTNVDDLTDLINSLLPPAVDDCCDLLLKTVVESEEATGTIDGSNQDFTLTYAPVNCEALWIYVNGLWLSPRDFTLNGNVITIHPAPALGSLSPYVIYLRAETVDFATPKTGTPTGAVDTSNTTYSIAALDDPDSLVFTINGLTQTQGVDYFLTGTIITTATAPVLGSVLYYYGDLIFPKVYGVDSVMERPDGLINSSNTTYTTSRAAIYPAGVKVAIDGTIQDSSDFSYAGNTLTFTSAPPTGSEIMVFYTAYDCGKCCDYGARTSAVDDVVMMSDFYVGSDATSGNRVVTLPYAGSAKGKHFVVGKIDSSLNTVTIQTVGGEFIGGGSITSFALTTQDENLSLASDGTRYYIT
jgi:hypothetical protein